jgi:Zn finger protein HypA/HybF involved in hydrogenase expression
MPEIATVRCVNCNDARKIADNPEKSDIDISGTDHSPKTKAYQMQRRVGIKCPECGETRFAVGVSKELQA